jgi:hypothetical protein
MIRSSIVRLAPLVLTAAFLAATCADRAGPEAVRKPGQPQTLSFAPRVEGLLVAIAEGEGTRDLNALGSTAEDALTDTDVPELPSILQEIVEHAQPVLSTDGSHDIPNAAAAHDAELDREAAEGMTTLAPPTTSPGQEQAAVDMDESLAAARARLGLAGGDVGGSHQEGALAPRAEPSPE